MSKAAEDAVKACTHPKVKGCARALLDTIAELIPEGQTMTATIAIPEFVTLTGYYEKSIRQARDVLVEIGMLRTVGGGRGRPASYELLPLPGAGADPSLPLLGRVPRSRPQRHPLGPTLFDQPVVDDAVRADDIGTKYRRSADNIGTLYRRWIAKVGTLYRRCVALVSNVGEKYRPLSRIVTNVGTGLSGLGVDDARAGAIRKSKYEVEEGDRASAREADTFVDWFDAEYAAVHHGARCANDRAPDGGRVGELLRRGRTVDRLKLMTAEMWRMTTDGVPGSDRWYIAERAPVRNIWLLHRKADFLDAEVNRRETAQARAPDLADVRRDVEQRIGRDWRKSG